MEIEAKQDDRGYALIANFVDGFALGWKMAVSESFKEALDIKLTPRTFEGSKQMLWTQGHIYSFREGDTIYDTRMAYTEWKEALKHITLMVQIQFSLSSSYVIYETYEINDKELSVIHQKSKEKPKKETIDGLLINKKRINHGVVKFKVYRPNKERTGIKECELIECTQDDFVAFLQTGIVRTNQNNLLNLFINT